MNVFIRLGKKVTVEDAAEKKEGHDLLLHREWTVNLRNGFMGCSAHPHRGGIQVFWLHLPLISPSLIFRNRLESNQFKVIVDLFYF